VKSLFFNTRNIFLVKKVTIVRRLYESVFVTVDSSNADSARTSLVL
jgi:hypothetical protein